MTDQATGLAKLREQFPPELIGKLPRVTCGDCSKSRGSCPKHQRQRCDECNSWISTKHIHLDYVGHADTTARLLDADPAWQWEPLATDEHGLPLLDTDERGNPVGLWIRLTVCGVTRLGYGSCPSGQNDAVKVLIGDALRNAAMRFGVALDLWAKGDRADPAAENATAAGGTAARRRPASPITQHTDMAWYEDILARIRRADSMQELATLATEVEARRTAGGCADADYSRLWEAGKDREAQLAASVRPTNKDGSTSRSRASDEQLAANGEMTKAQLKEHNQLVKDVRSNPKKAERTTAADPDDPWATS